MPDHVYVVFALGERQTPGPIVASFGKYTARRLNELTGRQGRVWQHGFYDHCLRDENSYLKHLRYVIENPVRKGWVTRPEDWPYSAVEPDW